jgi:hypothetical protein
MRKSALEFGRDSWFLLYLGLGFRKERNGEGTLPSLPRSIYMFMNGNEQVKRGERVCA